MNVLGQGCAGTRALEMGRQGDVEATTVVAAEVAGEVAGEIWKEMETTHMSTIQLSAIQAHKYLPPLTKLQLKIALR